MTFNCAEFILFKSNKEQSHLFNAICTVMYFNTFMDLRKLRLIVSTFRKMIYKINALFRNCLLYPFTP